MEADAPTTTPTPKQCSACGGIRIHTPSCPWQAEVAALRAERDAERLALKLACGESVDLRAERDELRAAYDHLMEVVVARWHENSGGMQIHDWLMVPREQYGAWVEDARHVVLPALTNEGAPE